MSKYRVKVGSEIVEVVVQDANAHPVIASIGDQQFEIWIQEEEGPQTSTAGAQTGTSGRYAAPPIQQTPDPLAVAAQPRRMVASGKTVRAPMPGLISKILVSPGAQVQRGDILCVLEAMKMNNQIRAPQDGTIASLQTEAGTQVNYGDPLVVFE